MDIEEQQRRTISEQREQLMQQRAQLKLQGEQLTQLKKEMDHSQAPPKSLDLGPEITRQLGNFHPRPSGTTIGLQIPQRMKDRVLAQLAARKPEAKNYGHVILVCIELGLQCLERDDDARRPVETVQRVLGANDPGDGPDTASDRSEVSRGTSLLADHQG